MGAEHVVQRKEWILLQTCEVLLQLRWLVDVGRLDTDSTTLSVGHFVLVSLLVAKKCISSE